MEVTQSIRPLASAYLYNAFHNPPLHLSCAHELLGRMRDTEIVTTAGFEFVRPGREDDDRRPTFQPNSLL